MTGEGRSDTEIVAARLAALPADAGEVLPSAPVAIAVAQAVRLCAAAAPLRDALAAVPGYDPRDAADLPALAEALREAERRWLELRDDAQRESVRTARALAEALACDLAAAFDLLPVGLRPAEGRAPGLCLGGMADLLDDLLSLGDLAEERREALRPVPGLPADPPHRARNLAQVFAAAAESRRALEAQTRRNRLAVALWAPLESVRRALRWVQRADPVACAELSAAWPRPVRLRAKVDERLMPA